MPVEKLPLWLACINPNKVAQSIRPKLELYQAESAIALHDYWTMGAAVNKETRFFELKRDAFTLLAMAVWDVRHRGAR